MGRRRTPWPELPPERPDEPQRLQLARAVRALADEQPDLFYRELGEAFGISRSYAADLLKDPAGEAMRERHEQARGTCADCGGPTAWAGGDGPATRCASCERARVLAERGGHGTLGSYSRGCRCDACRAANAAYNRERQRRRYHADPEYRERRLAAHRAWVKSPAGQAYLARRREEHRLAVQAARRSP